ANLAMRALILANGINIVLDPCLIYGLGPFPALGVTGAAVATNIGRSIGILYGLYYLFGGGGRIRVHLKDMALKLTLAWAIVRVSLGGMAQFLVATASWVFLMQIVAGFGSAAVAGYTIAVRIILFLILPVWGLCNASATLVGQNLGAGLPERAETTVWFIARYATYYMAATVALVLLFTRPIVLWFTSEPEAVEYAVASLRILSYGFIFLGFGTAIIQAFNGAGDTMTPTYINVFCFWVVQVPLAYALALALGLGPEGVFWAVFVSDMLTGIVGILLFKRGTWKLREV
ncbi:MAG: MATE family efflux transporter, partial [Pseudohongiellaceae bacterium]